ncbi:uncharacterized protein LOC103502595 isoform X2 [Cucumis melo]|uniref:Uncharacterized protein LOC103502595 isoform X2 n=1 Tax=Cucumis melo TaxID=3656 RepID=A0A1S3CMD8_CUCME|nr:uncharacterized protein LOC103502595 isoform X2 [Cucumis melo]
MASELVVHNGGCHCKKVRWRVEAPASVVAWDCNCSNCFMRANTHFIVPLERFKLLGDSSNFVSTYTFGSHTAKHTFCKNCGITSFYRPRSNPDGVAITFKCVDPGTLTHVEVRQFDGSNWEASYDHTGIASFSKLNTNRLSIDIKCCYNLLVATPLIDIVEDEDHIFLEDSNTSKMPLFVSVLTNHIKI